MVTFPNPFAALQHATSIRRVETQANETLAGIVLFIHEEVDPPAACVFAIGHLPDFSHEETLAAALGQCEIPLRAVPEEFHSLKGLLLLRLHICPKLPRLHFGDFVIVHILEFFPDVGLFGVCANVVACPGRRPALDPDLGWEVRTLPEYTQSLPFVKSTTATKPLKAPAPIARVCGMEPEGGGILSSIRGMFGARN